MKYGIILLGNRVSPRCSTADSIFYASQRNGNIINKSRVSVSNLCIDELNELLVQGRVDIFVCGGITTEHKNHLYSQNLAIIDNVSGTVEDIIQALKSERLCRGYGFDEMSSEPNNIVLNDHEHICDTDHLKVNKNSVQSSNGEQFDCLKCTDKVCLDGKFCNKLIGNFETPYAPDSELLHMMEAATDIACEKERTLCRLSELIYFCLEMQYERLGVAYCIDLEEPAEILVRVLRRFFTVFPVCCQVGAELQTDYLSSDLKQNQEPNIRNTCCNPWGQAQLLNRLGTDLNVMVGLCMGADCVFMQGSLAPATGLFIKDKSLANNPIGAIYSEYYLREAVKAHS